jgi:hypothetical protein
MYGSLPKNEMTVHFDEIGVDTGLPYQGDFIVKCALTIQDKHSVALEKTRLMADTANPTGDLAGIAVTLAEVRARIIKAPEWWAETDRGAKMFDENILLRLYDKFMDCEDNWKTSIRDSAIKAREADEKKAEEAAKPKPEAQAEGN